MIIVVVLAIVISAVWFPPLVPKLLRARRGRVSGRGRGRGRGPKQTTQPSGAPSADAGTDEGPRWSALDDRQLTRLLTDSGPRSITE